MSWKEQFDNNSVKVIYNQRCSAGLVISLPDENKPG
jgi:hypothetical protein